MSFRAVALVSLLVWGFPSAAFAQERHYWRNFALGAASSILLHEAGHVGASLAVGGRPYFGFDKGRPTVYSGIDVARKPREQFVFSTAGLNVQALADEILLDVPHGRAGAFERGVLAAGIGTALFYVTIGRTGSVSDIDFIARTGVMSKTQASLLYGGIAAMHTVRIARNGRYAAFFAQPSVDGAMKVGVHIR